MNKISVTKKYEGLRWFPHMIRAIMAKIKLIEKPGGMLFVWIQLIRTYRDLSSQACYVWTSWHNDKIHVATANRVNTKKHNKQTNLFLMSWYWCLHYQHISDYVVNNHYVTSQALSILSIASHPPLQSSLFVKRTLSMVYL